MYDTNDLIKAIKKLGVDAFEATKPVNVLFGKVINASPLQVQIEQKMILTSKQLLLSEHITNRSLSITINDMSINNTSLSFTVSHNHPLDLNTTTAEGHIHQINGNTREIEISENLTHNHVISGTFNITLNNALKINDEVILVRIQGGQKYLILDRIGG